MGTHGSRGSRAIVAETLALLVLVAVLGLAACGSAGTKDGAVVPRVTDRCTDLSRGPHAVTEPFGPARVATVDLDEDRTRFALAPLLGERYPLPEVELYVVGYPMFGCRELLPEAGRIAGLRAPVGLLGVAVGALQPQ